MEELYLSKYPTVYTKRDVAKYLMDKQLLFKVGVEINHVFMMDDPKYGEHVHNLVARNFAEKMMEEKKMKLQILDHPLYADKRMEATAILLSQEDLIKLLYHFGIHFVEEKRP